MLPGAEVPGSLHSVPRRLLTTMIQRATSRGELMRIVAHHVSDLNAVHADAVLRKVVGLLGSQTLSHAGADLLQIFEVCVGRVLTDPNAELRQVVGILWCSAKAKHPQIVSIISVLEERIMQLANQINPQAVANILFSYSVLSTKPSEPIMGALREHIRTHAAEFEAQATINTLQALSRLGLRRDFQEAVGHLQGRVADHARAGQVTAPAAASLLSAYASMKFMPSAAERDALLGVCDEKRDEFDPQAVTTCLNSLAKLQAVREFKRCVEIFGPRLQNSSFGPQILASFLRAELDPPDEVFEPLCAAVSSQSDRMALQELAPLLVNLAELGRSPGPGQALSLLRSAAVRATEMDRSQRSSSFWACAVLTLMEPLLWAHPVAIEAIQAVAQALQVSPDPETAAQQFTKKQWIAIGEAVVIAKYCHAVGAATNAAAAGPQNSAVLLRSASASPPPAAPTPGPSFSVALEAEAARELAAEAQSPARLSPAQREVITHLKETLGASVQEGAVKPEGCVRADIGLPDLGIAVVFEASKVYTKDTRRQMGRGRAALTVLAAAGWSVAIVPEHAWEAAAKEDRAALISAAIAAAAPPNAAGAAAVAAATSLAGRAQRRAASQPGAAPASPVAPVSRTTSGGMAATVALSNQANPSPAPRSSAGSRVVVPGHMEGLAALAAGRPMGGSAYPHTYKGQRRSGPPALGPRFSAMLEDLSTQIARGSPSIQTDFQQAGFGHNGAHGGARLPMGSGAGGAAGLYDTAQLMGGSPISPTPGGRPGSFNGSWDPSLGGLGYASAEGSMHGMSIGYGSFPGSHSAFAASGQHVPHLPPPILTGMSSGHGSGSGSDTSHFGGMAFYSPQGVPHSQSQFSPSFDHRGHTLSDPRQGGDSSAPAGLHGHGQSMAHAAWAAAAAGGAGGLEAVYQLQQLQQQAQAHAAAMGGGRAHVAPIPEGSALLVGHGGGTSLSDMQGYGAHGQAGVVPSLALSVGGGFADEALSSLAISLTRLRFGAGQ